MNIEERLEKLQAEGFFITLDYYSTGRKEIYISVSGTNKRQSKYFKNIEEAVEIAEKWAAEQEESENVSDM